MQRARRASGFVALLVAIGVASGGCGDTDADEPDTTGLPLSVEGLLIAEPEGDVSVIGFLVVASDGPHLCEALAESFPPQCGGVFVEISSIDHVDVQFEEAQGVRWTDPAVVLEGRYTGEIFEVQGAR